MKPGTYRCTEPGCTWSQIGRHPRQDRAPCAACGSTGSTIPVVSYVQRGKPYILAVMAVYEAEDGVHVCGVVRTALAVFNVDVLESQVENSHV